MILPSSILFSFFLLLSMMTAMSSSSWFIVWVALEINTISFISIIFNKNNQLSSESCFKYFFVQAISSIILLFFSQPILNFNYNYILISMALLFKLAASPFHLWFLSLMRSIKWLHCLILSTIQKLIPLSILFSIKSNLIEVFTITSVITGGLGGLNQTNLKTLVAYSSIAHLGWMLSALFSSFMIWSFYWNCYFFLSLSIILVLNNYLVLSSKTINSMWWPNQLLILLSFLSLGGLPPLFGFLPKWFLLNNLIIYSPMISMILVMTSILNLYFYIRIFYGPILLSSPASKMKPHYLHSSNISTIFMSVIILTLPLAPLLN